MVVVGVGAGPAAAPVATGCGDTGLLGVGSPPSAPSSSVPDLCSLSSVSGVFVSASTSGPGSFLASSSRSSTIFRPCATIWSSKLTENEAIQLISPWTLRGSRTARQPCPETNSLLAPSPPRFRIVSKPMTIFSSWLSSAAKVASRSRCSRKLLATPPAVLSSTADSGVLVTPRLLRCMMLASPPRGPHATPGCPSPKPRIRSSARTTSLPPSP
mmetsp:Transcript_1353/g.3106  ORF Transcript_1353/g.3106 Transcript_1353/m.3106 type:complete len:214 (+) Transcript_1353:374-1015(+)